MLRLALDQLSPDLRYAVVNKVTGADLAELIGVRGIPSSVSVIAGAPQALFDPLGRWQRR